MSNTRCNQADCCLNSGIHLFSLAARAQQPAAVLALDVSTDKARYAPHETAIITLTAEGVAVQRDIEACVSLESLGTTVLRQCNAHLTLQAGENQLSLRLQPAY